MDKQCRICKIKLSNENWNNSNQKQGNYICNKHYNEYKRKLKREHRKGIKRRLSKPRGFFFYPDMDGRLVAKIPLTQQKLAIVDIHNADKLSKYQWQYDNKGYAKRIIYLKNQRTTSKLMHHDIFPKKEDLIIDHINWNRLDNHEMNLRYVTERQNAQNHKRKDYSSKYPGVCWNREKEKWVAYINIKGKQKHLKYCDNEEEAYNLYKQKVEDLGEEII
jgi:hypothetical protein